MDLIGGLERALHGKVKPMITQCSIRHLYNAEPRVPELIEQAKRYERRRCNHHTLDQPLSTLECLQSVVDSKGSRTNKHRYVVACQGPDVRAVLRTIPGVPLIYINRSVMILEPMTSLTSQIRAKEERSKFRAGLVGKRLSIPSLKRKREGDDGHMDQPGTGEEHEDKAEVVKKSKRRGPKGPNPLSVKKAKKSPAGRSDDAGEDDERTRAMAVRSDGVQHAPEPAVAKKRKRKHKSHAGGGVGRDSVTEDSRIAMEA
ncbi:MAG: hypothetical protein M1838_004404 [Thelocarpon superellum]|nr:MAG: hypothetical protein M1838_004404 [Thelocarpon superellum]